MIYCQNEAGVGLLYKDVLMVQVWAGLVLRRGKDPRPHDGKEAGNLQPLEKRRCYDSFNPLRRWWGR